MKPEIFPMVLAVLLLQVACDRNVAPFDPAETPHQPDLSRIFPAPEEDVPMGAAAGPATAARGTQADGPPIRGTVSLAPQVLAPPGAVLFVIARPAGMTSGPPLAAVRIGEPRFPLEFQIGPADVMPGTRFAGSLSLSARLDTDGNATSRQPSDLEGFAAAPVEVGSSGVAIVLGGDAAATAASAGVAPQAASGNVRGTIRLADGARSAPTAGAVLFVIARAAGQGGGPPLAVLRIPGPRFPLDFEIGQRDVMIPSLRFEGEIELLARLDSDGNASTQLEGDLQGAPAAPLRAGASGVEIRLE